MAELAVDLLAFLSLIFEVITPSYKIVIDEDP
jgi:hypothetical protein